MSMAIFHSYVKLPEGICGCFLKWSKPKSSTSDRETNCFGGWHGWETHIDAFDKLTAIVAVQSDGILTKWSAATNEHPVEQTIPTLGWVTFLETYTTHLCALLVYVPLFIYLLVNLVIYKQIDLSTGPHGPTLYRMFLAHNTNRVCAQLYEQPRKWGKQPGKRKKRAHILNWGCWNGMMYPLVI